MSTIPILLGLVLAVPANSDESVLGAARLPTTDKAVLNFFYKRSQPPPGRAAIEQLARALGSNNSAEADDVHAELLSIGPPVVSVLRELANRVDEVRASKRAKQILLMIEGPQADRLPIDAARLLAVRKSPGAVEALLGYLPVADNDGVFEEIVSALGSLSVLDGKADPALLAALKSAKAFTRAAAARALCKAGSIPSWKAVRPLLTDSDPAVRFQVASALADAHDGQAIPVLIECLSDGPPALAAQAEECLARLAGEWTVHGPGGSDLISRELRREVWATWWQKTSAQLLLREVQARTLTDEELARAEALLRKLETEQGEAEPAAARDLVVLGPRVGPLLRRAVQEGHPRLGPAAARCLEAIELEFPQIPLPEALFRMLALRRPPGTVAALLAVLPCVENEEMIAQLSRVLVEVGVADGKADTAFLKALDDRAGIRRAVAAVALRKAGIPDLFPAARKLLADKDIEVRRRVALGLAEAGDKEGAVALSGLLEVLPQERAWEIEEQLERLAGGKAPAELTANPTNWKKVAGAWRQWWQGEGGKVVMTDSFVPASGGRLRGYTLLVQPQSNTITELGPDGKPRWTLTGLQGPSDAQVLANQHVLVAEQGRVTERDLSGNVLWKLEGIQPLSVQRLANGNTFIACSNLLVEVDRAGKDILRVPVREIVAARRLPDRRIVALARPYIIHLDEAGREIKQIPVMIAGLIGGAGCNEVLDNGHVLYLSPGYGNISEFDMEGKSVGSFDQPGASHGFRLPNGHTLLTVQGNKYIELDEKWKPIKETVLATPAFRVKQR
jgi:HEAT repeat protein